MESSTSRVLWKGAISLGLVHIPVALHSATQESRLDGTLKSWAVPKGPSLDPAQGRMAVHVEDHPLTYANFEGVIPPTQYGAGTIIVWDRGTWDPVTDPEAGYRVGKLNSRLHGEKLKGGWTLVRMRNSVDVHQNRTKVAGMVKTSTPAGRIPVGTAIGPAQSRETASPPPKRPASTRKNTTAAPPRKLLASAEIGGVLITHPERVIDSGTGLTKMDLVRY